MLDEVNEIIMSNLTRFSIKAKAATATAWKDCVKACLSKAEEIYRDEAKFTKYCICWFYMSDWCFMLLPSCSSDHACSLPKDEGACFAIIPMYYYDNGEKICRMFFIRRLPRKRQPFWFSRALSDILSRSLSLVLPFLNSIMLITWN